MIANSDERYLSSLMALLQGNENMLAGSGMFYGCQRRVTLQAFLKNADLPSTGLE